MRQELLFGDREEAAGYSCLKVSCEVMVLQRGSQGKGTGTAQEAAVSGGQVAIKSGAEVRWSDVGEGRGWIRWR